MDIFCGKLPLSVRRLRHEGVRGTVCADGFNRRVVFNEPGCFIEIRMGRLDDVAWDFGYQVIVGADAAERYGCRGAMRLEKIPGEGSGWMDSERDAALFVAYLLRAEFAPGSPVRGALDREISGLVTDSLF